jgi:MFS family permease
MGLLLISGNVAGVMIAGMLIDAAKPLPTYQQGVWLTYGAIIIVLVTLMLITVFSLRERTTIAAQDTLREAVLAAEKPLQRVERHARIRRSMMRTVVGTILVTVVVWGVMAGWNAWHVAGLEVSGGVEQVVLELIVTVGLLRIFDFHPRRDPDFAWVFVTRLVMMMGIYTIQTFLQYYMRDVVGAVHSEQQTTNFVIFVSLTSLVSAFAVGWLSDHFGRKRMVYLSGGLMSVVGFIFIITHSLPIVLAAGAIFGLGYGAYSSVDWALVADVLPSQRDYARDMGIWNIALSLPQVIAPVLGGPLIDSFTRSGNPTLGFQLLFAMAIVYCVIGTVTVRYIRGVKK